MNRGIEKWPGVPLFLEPPSGRPVGSLGSSVDSSEFIHFNHKTISGASCSQES